MQYKIITNKQDPEFLKGVQAFAEDKTMIEAQQRVIDITPDPQVMPTAHDKAVTLYNRLVERLARAERAQMENAA